MEDGSQGHMGQQGRNADSADDVEGKEEARRQRSARGQRSLPLTVLQRELRLSMGQVLEEKKPSRTPRVL